MTAERVVVWRHGRTAYNHEGIWQGQLDIPLDDVGRLQAKAAAQALREVEPVAIVASDLSRAADTAQALADVTGLPVTHDRRLREIYARDWEGLTRAQIEAAGMGDAYWAYRRGEDVPAGGGERVVEVGRRGAEAIAEHAAALDGGTLVVAAHGMVLRCAVLTLLGIEPRQWEVLGGLANCAWGVVAPKEQGWRLLGYGVTATRDVV